MSLQFSERADHFKGFEHPHSQGPAIKKIWYAPEAPTVHRPILAPPDTATVETTPHILSYRSHILSGLLGMADSYDKAGSLHQAIEIYFSLIREHEGTTQAEEAAQRVLDIARGYEETGEPREARAIYEQLL